MKKISLISGAFAAILALTQCNKTDFQVDEWGGHASELALPLFNATIEVRDLVNNILTNDSDKDSLIIQPDNTIRLIYSGDVVEEKATKIFRFFETGFIPVLDTNIVAPFSAVPNGISIRKADLSHGNILINLSNQFSEPITGFFRIPNMAKDGQVLEIPFNVPANTLLWASPVVDISGYHLESTGNTLTFQYFAYLPNGDRVRLIPPVGFPAAVVISFGNLEFQYLEGYWAATEYELTTDTIDININQTNLNGNVKVVNPKVTISILNSFGFPTRGLVKQLKFIGKDGTVIPLESTLFPIGGSTTEGIDFLYPSLALGEVGQTKSTDFAFDDSNSNIEDIFNSQPVRMIYQVSGLANAESDPNLIGFLTDSSSVRLNVKVDLLLQGSMQNFSADQTVDLDFSDVGGALLDSLSIDSVAFKLVTDNGLPMDINLQLYFQDEAGQTIDSLFHDGPRDVLRAAPVDGDGVTTGVTQTTTYIPMDAARFSRIRQSARKAVIETLMTTSNGGTTPIYILANQQAEVRMGVRIKTKI